MSLKDLVNGETVSHKKGKFMLVERALPEMGDNPITRYIAKHRDYLILDSIRAKFPQLTDVPKREMLFFDNETTGLSGNNTIFSIGLTHLTEGVKTSCLFARDYWEERAILRYFLDLLPQHHAFFGYNSTAFDLPRLDSRLRAHGLYNGTPLKEALNHDHIDLMQEMRKARPDLPDYRLQTIEKLIFGMSREGDIPSSQVPKAYRDYMAGKEGSEEKMAKVIKHNMRDTLTLVAVLAYLCGRKRRRR
jgi:uncharacterized protein YprB with RNaseH-like and TPR domain